MLASPRRPLAALAALATIAGGLATASGCKKLTCCNSCGRNYYVVDEAGGYLAYISNHFQGGDECEIDDEPRSLDDATYTAQLEVVSTESATPEVHELSSRRGAHDHCDDGTLAEDDEVLATASDGDVLCVVVQMQAQTMCTQLACGGGF